MTLQQLDDVLKTWQGRLSAMAENLLELQSDANYRSLTGEGGLSRVSITGATAARVSPAISSIHELFRDFGALQSTVEQAVTLRRELPSFFGADAKAREIQRLLFSASIVLETDSLPREARALLTEGIQPQRITPEEMMQRMARRFAEVRDAVDTAGSAWADFGAAADRLELELVRLRGQRSLPSALIAPALDTLQRELVSARTAALTDPLGALGLLQRQVEPAMAQIDGRVLAGEKVNGQLRLAQARCEELQRSQASALAVWGERDTAVIHTAPVPTILSQDKLQALMQWLRRLEEKCDEGATTATTVGLRNWMTAADSCLAENQAAISTAEAQIAQAQELRGRWRALKAKARARGLPEAEVFGVSAAEAERQIKANPLDLEQASAALARFETELRISSASLSPKGTGAQ